MTLIEQVAEFVTDADAARLPPSDRAVQRMHFCDAIVAAVVGARTDEGSRLAKLCQEARLGDLARVGAQIRLTEIDDIHLPSCTTPHSAIAPIVLALAARNPSTASRAADALWVGIEVMTRFGVAVRGPDILYREIWPTYLAAPLAVCAAACRMSALDAARTAQALSIALTLSAGGSGRFRQSPSARWLLHGVALRSGGAAALAGAQGFGGDLGLLDRDWLAETHGAPLHRDDLLEGLGEGSVFPALSLKPFCAAKQTIAAVEAFRMLLRDVSDVDAIAAIDVFAPQSYLEMISDAPDVTNRGATFTSVRYQIALAALHPDRLFDIDRADMPLDGRMTALMNKIAVAADPALAIHYPHRWPARVAIQDAGGARDATVLDAPGDPGRRLDEAAFADKARRVLDPVIGADARADWLANAVRALDDPKTLVALARSLGFTTEL